MYCEKLSKLIQGNNSKYHYNTIGGKIIARKPLIVIEKMLLQNCMVVMLLEKTSFWTNRRKEKKECDNLVKLKFHSLHSLMF